MAKISVAEAIREIESGKSVAEVLSSLPIVRIRRLAAELGVDVPRKLRRKAEIIAAFVAGMAKPQLPEPGLSITRAVRILANQQPYEDIVSVGMRMLGTSYALVDDLYRMEEAPKEAQDARFMEVLKKKLAKGENDVEAAIAIINEAAKALIACFEERCSHNWKISSYDCKSGQETKNYETEQKAWSDALSEFNTILDTVKEGGNFVHALHLKRIAARINRAEAVEGGYFAKAKIWRGKGKVRIYVNVYDADGKPQLSSLYIESGAVYWQYGEPRKRPVWADGIIAVMKAAINYGTSKNQFL